jgi:hypothetical protein
MNPPYGLVFPCRTIALTAAAFFIAQHAHAITVGPGNNLSSSVVLHGTEHLEMTGGSIINGGANGYALRMFDDSTAHISGGLLRSTNAPQWSTIRAEGDTKIVIDGGQIEGFGSTRNAVLLLQESSALINGGTFFSDSGASGTVELSARTSITINGGTFTASGSGAAALHVDSFQSATITGGQFIATGGSFSRGIEVLLSPQFEFSNATIQSSGEGVFVVVDDNASVKFLSGSITAADEALRVRFGEVDIYGGSFNGGLADIVFFEAGATVNVYATSAFLGGMPISGPVSATAGTLSVVYVNGATEQLSFIRDVGTLNVVIVSEPVTVAMVAPMVGYSFLRRRR